MPKGEIHTSHDASLYILLSKFLIPNPSDAITSTGTLVTRPLNNIGNRQVTPIKPSAPLLCRSTGSNDFRFTIPNISQAFVAYVSIRSRWFWFVFRLGFV